MFLLSFSLARMRALSQVFLLHFYIFSSNDVTGCSLRYVERGFIYIALHHFYIFSVSCFQPIRFFSCSSAFTEKRAKEAKFAREKNFGAREENKFAREEKFVREEKLGNLLAWQLSTANETTVICK